MRRKNHLVLTSRDNHFRDFIHILPWTLLWNLASRCSLSSPHMKHWCKDFAVLANSAVTFDDSATIQSLSSGTLPSTVISGNYRLIPGTIEKGCRCVYNLDTALKRSSTAMCWHHPNILQNSYLAFTPGVYCSASGHHLILSYVILCDTICSISSFINS